MLNKIRMRKKRGHKVPEIESAFRFSKDRQYDEDIIMRMIGIK